MKDEMDIMREVSTTAAAQGSEALSKMIGRRINLSLPKMNTASSVDFLSLEERGTLALSVQCKILTGLDGKVLLTLHEKDAFRLISICYPVEDTKVSNGVLTEVSISVLKEIGNVVISSFAGALSMFLKKVVIPSPPTLLSGPIEDIMTAAFPGKDNEYMLIIDTVFEEHEEKINGRLEFMLTSAAIKEIQDACKRALKEVSGK